MQVDEGLGQKLPQVRKSNSPFNEIVPGNVKLHIANRPKYLTCLSTLPVALQPIVVSSSHYNPKFGVQVDDIYIYGELLPGMVNSDEKI